MKQPETAKSLIAKSIKHHDPHGNFNTLHAIFSFESTFDWNSSPEELIITMDFENYALDYKNLDREMHLQFSKDTCLTIEGKTQCQDFSWVYNFYLYIWGLPMKLNDPGIQINDTVLDTKYKGNLYKTVEVEYPTEHFKFHFDSAFALRGFQFQKVDNPDKGEIIWLEGTLKHKGISFPKKRYWYDLKTGKLLGTNEVIKISEHKN